MHFRNLILVSYDSVRADVAFSGKFPALERLRRSGVSFRQCVSSAPLTPVSHASVMTGLQPARHGIRHLFREQLDRSCETIASILRDRGYATSAVVSCPGLNRWYGIDHGFDAYDDEIPRLPDGSDPLLTVDVKLRGAALKRAEIAVRRSREMLEACPPDRPFCHFLHFFDAHWPYEAPRVPAGAAIDNAYEGEVAYLDDQFGQWLNWMEESGRLENTLIVLFGDHGEDLEEWYTNDRGGAANGHAEEMGHGCLLYDQTVMVPLVVSAAGMAERNVDAQVRLIDIFPTVLELLGVAGVPPVDGQSLARSVSGAPVQSRVGYSETFYPREQVEATGGQHEVTRDKKSVRIDNRWKVIFHLDSDEVEVYDLAADALERHNLLDRNGGTSE